MWQKKENIKKNIEAGKDVTKEIKDFKRVFNNYKLRIEKLKPKQQKNEIK